MKKAKGCIFVVDDNRAIVDSIEAQFSYCGFEVIKATDPKRALELADQIKPDVIIADIRMPKLNGIEFVKKFKQIQPLVKVIAMTGYYPDYEREISDAEKAGWVDRVIQKSFRALELERLVYDLLKTPAGEVQYSVGARGRVLIVDDEIEITELLVEYFRARGYSAAAVLSAEEAVMIYDDFNPEVVLTDIKMPKQDGIWLIKELRNRNRKIRIIVMTGQDNHPTLQRLKEETGIEEFFSKPFSLKDLEKLTQKLMSADQAKKNP